MANTQKASDNPPEVGQNPTKGQSSKESVPSQVTPTWWDRNRRAIYEIMKIIQICICLFFITVGIIMCFYNLFSSHEYDEEWYWWPSRKRSEYRNRDSRRFGFNFDDFWYFLFFHSLWFHVMISICGLIGAAGEVIWCQMVYAVLITVSISLTLYCPLPWFVAVGIIQEWSRPFYKNYNLV